MGEGSTDCQENEARFSVGTLIAQVSMTTNKIPQGDPFTVAFTGGPGIPKEYQLLSRARTSFKISERRYGLSTKGSNPNFP
jgi:hypothetical protein